MDLSRADYAPLTARPTRAEIDAARREALAGAFGEATKKAVRNTTGDRRIAVGIVGGFLTLIFVIVTIVHGAQGGDIGDWLAGLFCTGIVVLGFGGLYALFIVQDNRGWQHSVRLVAFARANELDVQPAAKPQPRPGALTISQHVRFRSLADLVSWDQDGLPAEVGTLHWSSGKNNSFTVRYLGVRLDVAVPRITFDARRAVHTTGDLYFGTDMLAADATLPSRHRPRLICRPAGRAGAREFFTDDLIALLTSTDHPANAEVVDGWFLAYYRSRDVLDPALWRRMFETADLVGRITAGLRDRRPPSDRAGTE